MRAWNHQSGQNLRLRGLARLAGWRPHIRARFARLACAAAVVTATTGVAVPAVLTTPASAATTTPTPVITGTNPTSPNASTTPVILGTADSNVSVNLYENGSCSGTSPDFPKIQVDNTGAWHQTVTVPQGTTVTFSAQAVHGSSTSECSNSVTYTAGIPTSFNWSNPSAITYGTPLSATQLNAVLSPTDAAANGTVTYSPALGTVLNAGANQTLKVTYQPNTGTAYLASSATVALTVNQAPQVIQFTNPGTQTYGSPPFTLSATGGGSGNPVTFSLAAGSAGCSLSGTNNSTVTITSATASGAACVINADQAGSSNYLAATEVQQSFTIAKATPSLTWPTPTAITYGATLGSALDATASVPGTFAYTLNGQAVTKATVPDAGTDMPLSVVFTPNDTNDYTTATRNSTITVNQASMSLTVTPLAEQHHYGDAPFTVTASSSNPSLPVSYSASGACINSGATVTITSTGTCSVTVSQQGNNDYSNAKPVTVTTEVAPYQPSVTWASPPAITYGTPLSISQLDASLTYTIDSSASPPTPGSWAYYVAPGDTALSAGTILDAGAYQVTAVWTPDPGSVIDYLPAQTNATITVNRATPTLLWSNQSVTYPAALDGSVLDASVADFTVGTGTVTPAGQIGYTFDGGTTDASDKILGAGDHSLTATFTPDPTTALDFTGATVTVQLTVDKGIQAIHFVNDQQIAHYGDPAFTVTAVGGGSTSPVTLSSTTPPVCTVVPGTENQDGSYSAQVTINAAGECKVAADQAGDDNYYAAVQVVQDESVLKADPTISWTDPQAITYGTPLGLDQLNASVTQTDAQGTYTYTLADGKTPASGSILDAGPDQVLNVSFSDTDGNYNDATATVHIDVEKAPQTITFLPLADHTYGDGNFGVAATGGGSGNLVTFTSTGNCTVSSDGSKVHITGAGSCSITASQDGSDNYLPADTVTQTFSIAKADQSIGGIASSVQTFTYGDPAFTVSATATSGLTVTFSAGGACSSNGTRITIVSAGDCVVTASQAGDDNYNPASDVSTTFTITKAAQAITGFDLPTEATYLDASIATSPSGGGSANPVELSTTSPACSVSGLTVNILHAGTCTVTASQAGNDNYLDAPSVSRSITIAKYTPTTAWSPQGVTYGTVMGDSQLNAALDPSLVSGSWAYSGVDSSNHSVDITTRLDAGKYTVTAAFTPDDPADVNAVFTTATITVSKADQTITFDEIGGTHIYGDPPFDVSATASSDLPVSFAPSTDTQDNCGLASNGDSTGTVSITHAGDCTVVASQDGNNNWKAAPSVSRNFTAGQATPTINWSDPADITYGTTLGGAQLDATADFNGQPVSGTFAYSPAAGTLLHAGKQQLSVVFSPTDTTDFTQASGTAALNVNQAPQTIIFGSVADHTWGDPDFGVSATGGGSGGSVTFTATGNCTVSSDGTDVHLTGAGTCTITANQAGNGDYLAAPPVPQTFNIEQAQQSIGTITGSRNGTPVTSFVYGDPSFTVSATGGGSGNPVTFNASGACQSGGTNGTTVVITAAGTCQISANQNGNTNFLPAATATQSFTVAKADQTITFPTISFGPAGPAQDSTATLNASASSGLPVTYSAAGACTLSGSTLTLTNTALTCTVTADQAGNADFNPAASVTQTFQVYYFGGFVPPVTNKLMASKGGPSGAPPGSFKRNSTVPVKFQFVTSSGISVPLATAPTFAISPTVTNSNPATPGNTFQWDPIGQQYIYNLGTKNMTAGVSYSISVVVGSATQWTTQITVS